MKIQKQRSIAMNVVIAVGFIFLIGVLFKIQIIDKDEYSAKTVSQTSVVVDAARGEILDRNGTPLVTNRQGNSIVFNYAYFPTDQGQRNAIIIALINLFEKNGQEYVDNLPIYIDSKGSFAFEEDRDSDIKWLKSADMLDLNDYATADNCIDALIDRYELEQYSKTDALKIASVCAEMKRVGFSTSSPYTFAEDVPTELVAIVMENSSFYKGVENSIVPYRQYVDGTIAPHILGRVSGIHASAYESEKEKLTEALAKAEDEGASEEEIAAIKRNAYTINDDYGNSGIEGVMESYLRGTRGVKTVSVTSDDKVSEEYTVTPKQGDTVILTIDSELQKVAQDSLQKRVESLSVDSDLPYAAAAVIVENVNTGEILACATYPSYDNSTWSENYSTWAADSTNPLWNRALMSTYEPGSTFKPAMAIAGLEEGVITPSYTWKCTSAYTYFSDHTFYCANYTAHGTLNVVHAIEESCNGFFYETGRLLGIAKMNEWASAFGLGQKTGIELNEAQGILAGKEYRESQGGVWRPGDTVQAAIGQSDNQFTLIQLCNYVATIANGGTRHVPHFVKSVKSYDYTETVLEKDPEVAAEIDINESYLNLVREGMLLVGTEGYCKNAFANLPVKAAAKTGTSEVVRVIDGNKVEGNNGFLISYAPYEDPEIAVAVVVESATAGSLTAVVVADIYDYYFSAKEMQTVQQYNQLLS